MTQRLTNYLSFLCLLACTVIYSQQITTDNTLSVDELILNNLDADCVDISNINSSVNGSNFGIGSFGSFQRGNSNFPFESGIILSTGNVNSAGNTANNDVLNDGDADWGTDPDLENTLGIDETLNATSVEFDFVSISNTLVFNYILASEEYFANFPCQYSDGFALLIREANSNGPYTNIALIPGTSTPVNTTTIHDEIAGFCPEENSDFFEGYNIGDTNYNGRTAVLTATANLTPNVAYRIKLVIADQSDRNYDSAVFIEANSFSPTVDLGPDFSTCADEALLDANINNPNAEYAWFQDGNPIDGANQAQYSVTESGNYEVVISIPLAGDFCTISDAIVVDISNTQNSTPMSNYSLCDDPSNDGQEVFNLNTKTNEAINSVSSGNYMVSYHTSLSNAENNIDPISGNYSNAANPQLIFVRIEETNTGCLAFNQFELIVNERPEIVDPPLMQVCDDETVDGFTTINLTENNDLITNGQPNLFVTYHYTQNEADTGVNPIPMPYVNDTQIDMVYVSVVNASTGCRVTTTLDIEVLLPPDIANDQNYYIDACDPDYDGFANFNLTSVEADILNGLTNVTVTYHETLGDALSGENPIPDPTNFTNTIQTEQIIYIRVVDNTTGCPSIAPIEIHPNLLLSEPNFDDIEVCDEGNDGIEEYDLQIITGTILGDLPDVTIQFYETEDDRDNDINALDASVPYTPVSLPQTLYLTLTSPTCTEIEDITLQINPIDTFPDLGQQTVCDTDQDGLTTTNLTSYNEQLVQGQTGYTISYFDTLQNAEDNTNEVGNFYNNTTNPFTVYVRITSQATSCTDISSFEILVNPAPEANDATPIIICDNDQDGFFNVNLEDKIPEIVSDLTDREIGFYETLGDANTQQNEINTPSDYNANTGTIYVRVENTNTGCISVRTIPIIINTLPVFTTISDYIFCENNTDNIGDFLLSSKDSEILNGQSGKEVLYFNSEDDAINNSNAIDKNSNYENSVNPETIFVRVQNVTDPDCYGISSFILSVGTNPEFNEPADLFTCDDGSNDGVVTIDLNEKSTEIMSGFTEDVSITYFANLTDFNNNSNAINGDTYENTSNPQEIFVRIENETTCFSTTSFTVNVIPVPTVTEISPFEDCDIDYDESISWDLTEAEINILDIRQENVVVSYFVTENDADSDSNPIQDPTNFINTTNPQTVFVKVTNTDFNCPLVLPIELNVISPPEFNDFGSTVICDNDDNSYDLNAITVLLGDNSQAIEITYYANEDDAINGNNQLDNNYNYQSNSDILFARIENTFTTCFYVYPFMIEVNERPVAGMVEDLEACDDNDNGQFFFDLETQTSDILGNQDPSTINVTYHSSEAEALSGLNSITGLYNATDQDIIYVRLENTDTGCLSFTEFSIYVHPLPVVSFEDRTICPENFPLIVDAYTGFDTDEYLWSTGEITSEIEITETGTYSITITTEHGCTTTEVFDVVISEPAIIETVEVIDFSDPNNITITVSGIGDYLFQLDGGEPQESGFFENVTLGYHTLTIIDQNGCASVDKEILVIDAPKHVTPNNDGAFDTWHIIGVETLPGTIVNIYDRYGKLLKQLTHTSSGWDGTYNGNPMPASDYWWSADVKKGAIEFTATGHFALRR